MEANNAAAMRDALENIYLTTVKAYFQTMGYDVACGIIRSASLDALTKPPRNCDVGTAEEQSRRMDAEYCTIQKSCYELPSGRECPLHKAGVDCRLIWAQMPYKEEGAK